MTYDGFPVDVVADRLTDADLARLAGQLEKAEEQGWRFERYAVCGVSEHRHRYWLAARLCDWLPKAYNQEG